MIRAYICSPLSSETEDEIRRNMLRARQFMKQIADIYGYRTYAPHAYLPELLDDTYREERALALSFDMKLLEICEIIIVCGTRISRGMQMEIEQAFRLNKEVYHWPDTQQAQLLPIKKWRQVYEMQIQK